MKLSSSTHFNLHLSPVLRPALFLPSNILGSFCVLFTCLTAVVNSAGPGICLSCSAVLRCLDTVCALNRWPAGEGPSCPQPALLRAPPTTLASAAAHPAFHVLLHCLQWLECLKRGTCISTALGRCLEDSWHSGSDCWVNGWEKAVVPRQDELFKHPDPKSPDEDQQPFLSFPRGGAVSL